MPNGVEFPFSNRNQLGICLQEFIPDGKDALMEVGVLQADAKTELDQQMASQQQAPG